MKEPKAFCSSALSKLTITLDNTSWPYSQDFFNLMVDACMEKACDLPPQDHEDAAYLRAIGEAMNEAIQQAGKREQDQIENIFE